MSIIGAYCAPVVICVIVLCGMFRVQGMFSVFCGGAKEGLRTVASIAPSLIGLITAVEMFKVSGALDVLTSAILPVSNILHLPQEVMPLVLLRPITGGGSIAMLDRLLDQYGANSMTGRVACVMCGSSETTFYTTALYFGSVGVKKIRHTLIAALAADLVCTILSGITVGLLF